MGGGVVVMRNSGCGDGDGVEVSWGGEGDDMNEYNTILRA